MTSRVRRFATILLILVLLSGCAYIVQAPRIAIKGASLSGLDSSGVDVEFHLGITNPNRFDLALLGYSYDLRVMTMPLSSGETKGSVVFPARTESDMRLPVHLNFNELLEIFKHQPNLDNLPYRMNARLRLQHPLGELVIPIEKAGTLNIPERYRPGATLDRLRDVLRNIR